MYNYLFSEGKIGAVKITNRIVMTAMGNHLANADGTVSEADIAFYAARAKGGTGLIITECATIDSRTGKGNLRQIAADSDRCVDGLRRLAEAVHRYGAKIAVQIYHPGRQGIASVNHVDSMKGASDKVCECVRQPVHAMSLEEIIEMEELFALGAERIKRAGVDAVEIHGAHGYLIGQFLSPYTNTRVDSYGGSFKNRMRFLDEIIDKIRVRCGDDFPIIVRYSADEHLEYEGKAQEGIHLEEGIQIARHLEEKKVDALDISSGIYETMNTAWEPVGFDQGWKINGPASVKKAVDIPVIGVSVIREPAYAEQILRENKVDFIGSARAMFADPDWAVKAKEGRENEIRHCISCLYCMESLMAADQSDMPMGCAINFEGCRETVYSGEALKKGGAGRAVAVIGAGPSGMEAARVLALRGFKPILLEREAHVGGQILLAEKPPKKEKTGWLIRYQTEQLRKLNVEVRLNQRELNQTLREIDPYAIIAAQGSKPIIPKSIKGLNGKHVHTPVEILNGELKFHSENILVVGSGMTGLETAELLASQHNRVKIFEMADEIGPGIFFQNLIDIMKRMEKFDVEFHPGNRLAEVSDGKAIFEDVGSHEYHTYIFDELVIALGTASDTGIMSALQKICSRVISVGDAVKAGRIEQAIRTGYLAAAELE